MEEKNDQVLKLFIVSDSIGETAQRMIHATLTQFPDLTQVEIKKFPYIKDEQEFLNVLQLAREQNAIVATTLVSESFNALGHQFAKEHDIPYVDYMSELIRIIETHTDAKPLMESGALRKLNDEYFKRIEAIEYSVKYDDGKHFTDIGEADALIVGVSRTSKTPLSMYLANKGYKIANIRRNRAETLGLSAESTYNSLERIKKELSYAEEVFKKLNATVINTEYKSIEESAFYIEKFLMQR